jgi:hypothetical protein
MVNQAQSAMHKWGDKWLNCTVFTYVCCTPNGWSIVTGAHLIDCICCVLAGIQKTGVRETQKAARERGTGKRVVDFFEPTIGTRIAECCSFCI